MSDTERDVSKALAAFGAPPLKYRSFTHAPILPPSEPEHAMVEPDAVDMPPPVNSVPPPPPPPIGAPSAAWDRMRPELDSYGEPLPPPQALVAEPPPPPPPAIVEQMADLPPVAPPLPHVTMNSNTMTTPSALPDATMPEMLAPEAMLAMNEPGPYPVSAPLPLQPVRLAAPGDLPLVDMFRILSARTPGQAAATGSRRGA